MRIALIGASGQLGTDLQAVLCDELVLLDHDAIELTDAHSVENALDRADANLVINAAAYNLVDQAEAEPDSAFAVNALGPRNLAHYCEHRSMTLLHVSTDYVFGGDRDRKVPYSELDPAAPLSAYGISKLAGEFFVLNECRRQFVVRTCGLYGHAAVTVPRRNNFVETMLRLGRQRDELRIVADQHCTPTSTTDLARAIAELVHTDAWGLYHATNAGATTWYDLASTIFDLEKVDVKVTRITSGEFGARAARPTYSVLDSSKLSQAIEFEMPAWQNALQAYLANRPGSND